MSDFQKNIQNWVSMDNKIKQYQLEIKQLRQNKNNLSDIFKRFTTAPVFVSIIDSSTSHLPNCAVVTDDITYLPTSLSLSAEATCEIW